MGYRFNHHLSHRIFRAPVARRGAPVAAPVVGGPDARRLRKMAAFLMYIQY